MVDVLAATAGTSYTFLDQAGCDDNSRGQVYTVEKHGYTDPAEIPWPDRAE
jgi:hypothetical protein